jgi:hypothetical protein
MGGWGYAHDQGDVVEARDACSEQCDEHDGGRGRVHDHTWITADHFVSNTTTARTSAIVAHAVVVPV